MTDTQESKYGLIITIVIICLILIGLSFLGGKSDESVSAEHLAVTGGFQLDDYYRSFYAPTLYAFLSKIYGENEIKKDFEEIYKIKNEDDKEVTDSEYIAGIVKMSEIDIVRNCAEKMYSEYEHTIMIIDTDEEKESFKQEYMQRVRGFLVDLNKARLRMMESGEKTH